MSRLTEFLTRYPAYAATLAGAVTLTAAFISQYGFGLNPCEMCWWQRYPYMVAIAILIIGHFTGKADSRTILNLLALTFAVNAGLAAYHVGVEQKWWAGVTTCSGAGASGSVEEMLKAIQNAPLIRCDEIQFSLFGISMAGYNFLIALALSLYCAFFGRKR